MSAVRAIAVVLIVTLHGAFATVSAQNTDDEDAILAAAREPWKGDFDEMVNRGFIRVLTTYNPLFFHLDGIQQSGMATEVARNFEQWLNKHHVKKKTRPFSVVVIPVPRDRLIPDLLEGTGDIAAANLTITPERQEHVDFSIPTYTGVSELVITGPAAVRVTSFDDLVSTGVRVRRSSSYFEHLTALNAKRKQAKKPTIPVREADALLEDHDLLDMVNVGVIPAIVVDSHKAALWAKVFDAIKVHEHLAVNTGGSIAWAFRKNSPQLSKVVNAFIKQHRKGTLTGNILFKRYFESTDWMENNLTVEAQGRFARTVDIIKRYSEKYDFDWLMITAQGYQESRLDQNKRSASGAIGIMQVLPSTAADKNIGIRDIENADSNVHAGVKYLRFLRDRYFDDKEIDRVNRMLFSFAAYNAGPASIARARKKAAAMGLDPNQWFNHVEVAASKSISREPVVYVRNIYKYYVVYRQLEEMRKEKAKLIKK